MHYYQFNIADYRKDTQHLSPIEHYIYRELMDWYYLDETPIPKITKVVLRRLRLVSENEPDLLNVLEEFFYVEGETWKHTRIEQEIATYKSRVETAKANGSKGGRPRKPRKTQPVNLANPKEPRAKLTTNHKPITNNQVNKDIADRVIDDLNSKAGKRFQKTDTNRGLIIGRLNSDFTESDCLRVVANRCQKWMGTEQSEYLRPDTLFRPAKFEGYLNDNGGSNANRPTGNPTTAGRKLTPPERTEAARQAAIHRDSIGQPPDLGALETHGGNVRPHLGESTG